MKFSLIQLQGNFNFYYNYKLTDIISDIMCQLSDDCKFINLYGCTEVAADSTFYEIDKNYFREGINKFGHMPIGYPISNTCIILLPNNLNSDNDAVAPVLIGDTGNIWIGGMGICENYINSDDEQSNFKYVNSKNLKKWLNDSDKSILSNFKDGICEKYIKFFNTGDIGVLNKESSNLKQILKMNDQ